MPRLSGAALDARIEKQCREDLESAGFGLPLDQYDCKILHGEHDFEPKDAEFTHRRTGATIVFTSIWTSDEGYINQSGSHYGNLEY